MTSGDAPRHGGLAWSSVWLPVAEKLL